MPNKKSEKEWTPEQISALRERLDLTQEAAGSMVGVGRSMWCMWERGRVRVTKPFQILLTLLDEGRLDGAK